MRIGQLSHSEPYRPRKDPEEDTEKNADDDYILRKLFKKSGRQSLKYPSHHQGLFTRSNCVESNSLVMDVL